MAKKSNTKKDVPELDFLSDDIFSDLAKLTGGDVLSDIDTVPYRIDTGNLAINYSCSGKFINGGVPAHRITEAFGPEGSGKSLIGSNLLYGAQRLGGWAIILDCENATNAEFMEKISHLDLKRVVRYTPNTLQRAFRQMHVSVKAIRDYEKKNKMPRRPIVIVFDSLTVLPCDRELAENDLPLDYTPSDWKKIVGRQEQPGERARVISGEMRKLQQMVTEEEVTVYIINQIREKIGVLYGNPEAIPGGNSLKFYASLRIRTQNKKKIEHKTLQKFSGVNMQIKNIKNRGFRPYVIADDVKLYFEDGIDPVSGLLNTLVEDERVVMVKNGRFEVAKEYLPEEVEEYVFSGSKVENRMPTKVILECPKLVDAETREQVETYLGYWQRGLQATESGNYSEKDEGIDDEGNPFETGKFVGLGDYSEE